MKRTEADPALDRSCPDRGAEPRKSLAKSSGGSREPHMARKTRASSVEGARKVSKEVKKASVPIASPISPIVGSVLACLAHGFGVGLAHALFSPVVSPPSKGEDKSEKEASTSSGQSPSGRRA